MKPSCPLGGTRPLGPRRGPTGEQILNSKRPVGAMDISAGIVAHKKNPSCAACAMLAEPPAKSQSRTWDPYSIVPIYRPHLAVDVVTDFRFEAHAEGTTSPWEVQKQRATPQFGRRHTRGHAQSGRQRPQRLCGIFTRFTRCARHRIFTQQMQKFLMVSTQNPSWKNRLKYLVL